MNVNNELLEDLAISGGFIDCLTDLPFDDCDANIKYMQETLARYYVFVQRRTARNRDFKRGENK